MARRINSHGKFMDEARRHLRRDPVRCAFEGKSRAFWRRRCRREATRKFARALIKKAARVTP
jgi:hypothetical protein